MFPKVSIILLNWNGIKDTSECLESLKKIDYPNFDVIVVDNNSDGNEAEEIKNKFGDFVSHVMVNIENLGFSGGNNVGIKQALENNSDYLLLLNNDTIVESDFLSKLISNKDFSDKIGVFTPMITYYNDKNTIWSAGGRINKIRASGITFWPNKNSENYILNKLCEFASGCCMLIKKEVIEKVGLLDEKYFLYLEDTDYCQRVISSGYKVLYVGSSRIYHKVFSTTAKANKLLPLYYSIRNRLYFAKKNLGLYFYPAFLYLILVFCIKFIYPYKISPNTLKVIIHSFKDFFKKNMGRTTIFDVVN